MTGKQKTIPAHIPKHFANNDDTQSKIDAIKDAVICTAMALSRLTGLCVEEQASYYGKTNGWVGEETWSERVRSFLSLSLWSDKADRDIEDKIEKGMASLPKLLIRTLPKMTPEVALETINVIFQYRQMTLIDPSCTELADFMLQELTTIICDLPIEKGDEESNTIHPSAPSTTPDDQQQSGDNGKMASLSQSFGSWTHQKSTEEGGSCIDCTNTKFRSSKGLTFKIESGNVPTFTTTVDTCARKHSEHFRRVQDQLIDIVQEGEIANSAIDLSEGVPLDAFKLFNRNILHGTCFNISSEYPERHSLLYEGGILHDNIMKIDLLESPNIIDIDGNPIICKPDERFYISKRDVDFLRRTLLQDDDPGLAVISHHALGCHYLFNKSNPDKAMHHLKLCLESCNAILAPYIFGIHVRSFEADAIRYLDAYDIPGDQCAGCSNQRKRGMGLMQVCARCRRTCYCSRECQIKHWRNHKKCCRMKSEFKKGDHVMLTKTIPKFLPSCFEVVLQEENDDGSWLVSGVAVEREAVVTKRQIRVMTPVDRRLLAAFNET